MKSKKVKTVIRKYTNKKTGETKVKTYTYSPAHKSKGGTLVYKSGKKNIELINALKATYTGDDIVEFEAKLDSFMRRKSYKQGRLTVASMKTRMLNDTISKIIANFGYDAEDVAIELSAMYNEEIDVDYILNPNNWVQKANGLPTGQLRLPSGIIHEFKFDYHAGILI